jgi:hypothetical protein
MARGLDANQKAELVEFLEDLYRLGGYTKQKTWADEASYYAPNLSKALNRSESDGIDGYTLLKLMRAAAKRAGISPVEAARRSAGAEGSQQLPRDRLEEVADLVAEGLARVEAGIADVARRLPPEEHQDRTGEDAG